MAKLHVKKGDNVVVITGKDAKKTGKVLASLPQKSKVIVEGVNIVTKHKRGRGPEDPGGRIKMEAPIDSSNVMLVCPKCSKPTRIAHSFIDSDKSKQKKVRACKKCGENIDK